MVCLGEVDFTGEPGTATLKFDLKTRRLEWIELRLKDWRSDDPRLPELYSKLNFHKCRDGMVGKTPDWYTKEECFEPPNQIRRITWDPGSDGGRRGPGRVRSIVVSVFKQDGVYKAFMQKKAEERKNARQAIANDNFAHGK